MTTIDNPQKIQAYSKAELAMAYAPNITPRSAVKRLTDWIELCQPLSSELLKTGYRRSQKMFTPRQVALIFQFLGEP